MFLKWGLLTGCFDWQLCRGRPRFRTKLNLHREKAVKFLAAVEICIRGGSFLDLSVTGKIPNV
jgi:hypothetical protein